ncbi:MAG: MarC family protein [Asticcacaulis sp.]
MTLVEFYVNFFITLFALVDPIGNTPIFAAATQNQTGPARRWLSFYIALFTTIFLMLFFFVGIDILKFFGISMDAFRIAGGLILFLMGIDMARGDFLSTFLHADEVKSGGDPAIGVRPLKDSETAKKSFEKLVVPFAFPLVVGPGAISTVVIQADAAHKIGVLGMVSGVAAIVSMGAVMMIALALSNTIARVFGRVGMVIVVRVLGLILCAMAVQLIISSIGSITHGLILPAATHPYM